MLILLCNVCLATERGDMTKEEICKENFNKLFLADPLGKNGTDPEFMAILQKYIFGEIFTIGELDTKTRELITITVLGTMQTLPQLNAHINAALNVVNNIGMPECRIALSQATEYVARAKKRNLNIVAIDNAMADIKQGKDYPPPMHLRDAHYKGAKNYGFGEGYVYSHDNPDFIQQFMPDEMKDVKYF